MLALALQTFPWGELLTFAAVGGGLALILIRFNLRKPPELATTDEIKTLTAMLSDFKQELKSLEADYKAECASVKDMQALGEKVDRIDKFHLTVHDRSIKASTAARRALREAAELKDEVAGVRTDIREIRDGQSAINTTLGRIDERLKILTDRTHS